MSTIIPRIRGRAVQDSRGWYFEVFITIGEDTEDNPPISLTEKSRFLNKETALAKMHEMIPGLIEEICKAMGLPKPDGVLNLKNNAMESFDEFKQSGLPVSLREKR